MPTRAQLELAHKLYLAHEPRDLTYRVAVFLVEQARGSSRPFMLAESLALLLDSWNAAFCRTWPAARHRLVADLEHVLDRQADALACYERRSIESLAEGDEQSVRDLFAAFENVLWPVGASKALHLLATRFFPLWDDEIRKGYGLGGLGRSKHPGRYWTFMAITAVQVLDVGGEAALGRNPLKALDEFNYCRHRLKLAELLRKRTPSA